MTDPVDRRAELVAAAASDDLNPDEARELALLRATDPSIDVEIAELRAMIGDLGDTPWDSSEPDAALRDRVLAIGEALPAPAPVVPIARGRRWAVGLALAACVAGGAVIGGGAVGLLDGDDGPRPGAPGVLGALEHIDFSGEPAGVSIDGSLVAHTWGTETILEVAGLPAGESYSVVLVGADGASVDSGTFFGSTVTIDCRMNAALDRPEVDAVEIRDMSGAVVAAAELPAVAS